MFTILILSGAHIGPDTKEKLTEIPFLLSVNGYSYYSCCSDLNSKSKVGIYYY